MSKPGVQRMMKYSDSKIKQLLKTKTVGFFGLLFLVVLLMSPVRAMGEEPRTPEEGRVIRLTLPLEPEPVTGVLTEYSTLTFTVTTESGERHRVLWNAIPAEKVDRYWRYLEEPKGDAERLLELGRLLMAHREGREFAEKAFTEALVLDPTLAQAVERARASSDPDRSPRYVGVADPQMWGELEDATMQQGVERLHAFAQRTQRELEIPLELYESQRFMLLTDLSAEEIQPIAETLAEAYEVTAKLLGDDPAGNVFVGKCLVALFDNRVDYIRFQDQLHDTDARGTGGLCHGFGDGHVHVAIFQRASARQARHVLVHEVVHAYLHRYRSPRPLDDWLGEGLAEHVAHTVEPAPGQNLYLKSRLALEGKRGLGEGFFEGENLAAWQYDVAGALTRYLLERSEVAYPKLIALLKDDTPSEEALQAIYRMSPAKLTQRFKRRLDRELSQQLGG